MGIFIQLIVAEIKVENVVAYANVGYLDLDDLSKKLAGAEFDINQFAAILYRPSDFKSAVLIFGNGKVICTGPKSLKEATNVIETVVKRIKRTGVNVDDYEILVENIVASYNLGISLNPQAVVGLGDVDYNPKEFPGAIWHFEDVTAIFFKSGKVVFTDTKDLENIEKAIEKITRLLETAGFPVSNT